MWTAIIAAVIGAIVTLVKWWFDRSPNTDNIEQIDEIIRDKQRTKRDIDNLDVGAIDKLLERFYRK